MIKSSPNEFTNFMKTTVFTDFCNELDIRMNNLTLMLDDFDGEFTGRDYDRFRGGKRNMLEMKTIFMDLYHMSLETIDKEEIEDGE